MKSLLEPLSDKVSKMIYRDPKIKAFLLNALAKTEIKEAMGISEDILIDYLIASFIQAKRMINK